MTLTTENTIPIMGFTDTTQAALLVKMRDERPTKKNVPFEYFQSIVRQLGLVQEVYIITLNWFFGRFRN